VTEIRILIPIHMMPNTTNINTIFFQNLSHYMKTKSKIHLIWFVYMPEKDFTTNYQINDESVIDIHDYDNAYDVLKKEKPDLIYASPDWGFIDYAFSSAAKYCKIPVFFLTPNIDTKFFKRKTIGNKLMGFRRFFENSVPTDTNINQKQFFRRGRFFINKYLFLIKTQFKLKSDIFLTLFGIWKHVLIGVTDGRFGSDIIQFLENEQMKQYMVERGFKKSNLFVSGNPIYDSFFKLNLNNKSNQKNFTRILFAPSTAYEHGLWTIQQRDFTIKQIVKQISEKDNLKLIIKIHPSSSKLDDYSPIVNQIDNKIPVYQKGGINEYLQDIDVIITSPFSSSAETYALLAQKRIVICDFFKQDDHMDQLIEHKVAVSCKDPSMLIDSIENALILKSYEENRENFIKKFLYKWDGNSSKRIVDKLLDILEKNKL